MTDDPNTVTEADLHAFVDGFLDEERRRKIELWLKDHPEEAAEVRQWQAQAAALKAAFSNYAQPNANDGSLLRPAHPATSSSMLWRKTALIAASLMLFLSGAAAGIYGDRLLSQSAPIENTAALESLPDQSKTAFLIYASEKRHPVEVGADQEDHLVTWLGKRLDYKLVAPDLKALGFSLVGGRLLPVNGKAGAMLMYQDAAGQRLTVLLGKNPENGETSFRFESAGALETFYWIDGTIGYAVTGEVSRAKLQEIAEECYRQFES
ncbi:anti-sigma factor family protein [Rhizobium herbae]|uniref:Anti-sigma factor RsiW n=1 Tax=Rhizobium herbae TaxID=508661 RepID=A0ABS4EHE8_9HYPH|nr:anti-sigma factor [Rhizobium herbae]MBP1857369.1 anti-sigma factor RsiW [Rhizobium herbae]